MSRASLLQSGPVAREEMTIRGDAIEDNKIAQPPASQGTGEFRRENSRFICTRGEEIPLLPRISVSNLHANPWQIEPGWRRDPDIKTGRLHRRPTSSNSRETRDQFDLNPDSFQSSHEGRHRQQRATRSELRLIGTRAKNSYLIDHRKGPDKISINIPSEMY